MSIRDVWKIFRLALRLWRITRKQGRIDFQGRDWMTLRLFIALRDNFTCQVSREQATGPATFFGGRYHVDHIVPLYQGGSNKIKNLRLLRNTVHQERHSWMGDRG